MPDSPVTLDPSGHAARDLSRLAGVKLGNYRLERVLGRGRMGVVYLAQDEALLRPTAVKVLAWASAETRGQDPVQWFLGEARLVARINDPRVVQIYGAARQGDYCYIAMEYVAGQSTEAILAREGRLAPERATDILVQAASALHAAHLAGVVHRDVKPGNLLIGPDGTTKLGDFGMAHGLAGLAGVPVGQASVRAGTPFYTAPEIWRGEVATAASDIYALGATYFHLLTGRPPFLGADLAAVERAHLTEPVPDPLELASSLPPSCASLVRRALAKRPADRQPTAQVLMWEGRRALQELAAAGQATPLLKRPAAPPLPPPPERKAGSHPAPAPLAQRLQFRQAPFGLFDPRQAPFEGPPLDAVRRRLQALIEASDTVVVALTGEPGSGRSTLLRQLVGELGQAGDRLVLTTDGPAGDDGRTALQRLCRAAGVPDQGSNRVEGLLHRLGEELGRPVPVLVIDGLDGRGELAAGLETLVSAAIWSCTFKVVVAGPPGLGQRLQSEAAPGRPPGVIEVAVPPLDAVQVGHYVRGWLRAARPAEAPPIHLSADATLLVAHRSGGRPRVIDVIGWNMLALAAAAGRPTLTSWQAWAADAEARWPEARPPPELVPAPPGWPSPEARSVLDACRLRAGLPPWPAEKRR
jgi:serine/threonine-protein kinase